MSRSIPKIRAFSVIEEDEGTGGIVFARHPIVALKKGSSQFGDGEWRNYRAARALWADEFAETGDIPQSVAIAYGWWFECAGCGNTVNEDWLHDNNLTAEDVIGNMDGASYCCRSCQLSDIERKMRVGAAKHLGIEIMRDVLKRRFPDAVETKTYAYAQVFDGSAYFCEGSISFDFPGKRIGDASITLRRGIRDVDRVGPIRPEITCCSGDIEAFEAWAATRQEAGQ